MDGHWTASPWVVFMATMLGFGVALVVIAIWRNSLQRRVPSNVSDWLPLLERRNLAIVYSAAQLARDVKALVQDRAVMPPECQRIADQVLAYTQIVEEQLFEELAKEGIVPRYMFGGPVSDLAKRGISNDQYGDDTSGTDEQAVVIDAEPNVIQLPSSGSREWVGRQLLRKLP